MDDRDYEVGYGRPPKHSQFKKGTSGFQGRKHKKAASLSEQFERILDEHVSISEGGRTSRMSRLEIVLRQQVTKAMQGDRHSARLVLDFVQIRQAQGPDRADSATDAFLIAQLSRMIEQSTEGGDANCDE